MVLSLLRDVATLYTRVTPVDQVVFEFWRATDWEYCEDVTTDLLILVFFPRRLGKEVCMYVRMPYCWVLCFYRLELCYSCNVEYNVDCVF